MGRQRHQCLGTRMTTAPTIHEIKSTSDVHQHFFTALPELRERPPGELRLVCVCAIVFACVAFTFARGVFSLPGVAFARVAFARVAFVGVVAVGAIKNIISFQSSTKKNPSTPPQHQSLAFPINSNLSTFRIFSESIIINALTASSK